MRAIMGGVLALGFVVLAAEAATEPGNPAACKTSWDSMALTEKAKTTYSDYLKTCLENGPTAAPMSATKPVPPAKLNQAEKKQACESKWLAQKKITPTGSQTHRDFLNNCLQAQ
ncbi:MAG TPA: hypothetical protein VGH02_13965 [Rhizomicrobium sp.]|jgi:hypothetical protein